MWISGEPHATSIFGLGCRSLWESTHEDEEIQSLKYSCRAAFEEDCSPAGSPRPLLAKLLGKRPLRIGHLFLASLCCNACRTCQKIPLCVLQTASNASADTVVADGESIWRRLAKIRRRRRRRRGARSPAFDTAAALRRQAGNFGDAAAASGRPSAPVLAGETRSRPRRAQSPGPRAPPPPACFSASPPPPHPRGQLDVSQAEARWRTRAQRRRRRRRRSRRLGRLGWG